jgi:hypothetical protein
VEFGRQIRQMATLATFILFLFNGLVERGQDQHHLRHLNGQVMTLTRQPVLLEADQGGLQVQQVQAKLALDAPQLQGQPVYDMVMIMVMMMVIIWS